MNRIEWFLALMDRVSGPSRRIEQALKRVQSAESRVELATKHMNDALGRVRAPADMASRALGGLRVAATGLAVGAVALGAVGVTGALGAKSIIDAAGYKEQTLISFTSLLGDSTKAANVYAHAVQFAAATPFTTPDVIDATRQLLSYGFATKSLGSVMKSAGNLAAGANKPLEQVVTAFAALKGGDFGQAFGVGQGFSQLGINKDDLQGQGLVFDKQGGYKGSVEDAMNVVQRIIKQKFGDGMNAQSKSIFGLASTLQSRPFELFSTINEFGALEPFKKLLSNLSDLTDFSKPPGNRIQRRFIVSMGGLFRAVFGPAAAATAGKQGEYLVHTIMDKIDLLATWINVNGPGIVSTMKGIFGAIGAAIGFVTPIIAALGPYIPMVFAFFQTLALARGVMSAVMAVQALGGALGALRVGLALVGGPWGLLIAVFVAGAVAIYSNWGKIAPWFAGVWRWVVTAATNAFAFLRNLFFTFTPLGILIKNFAPIMAWFGSLPAQFAQFGANLIAGLVGGITSRLVAVKDTIVGAANSAIGWFKGALGIASPSKVFAGLGTQLPAGLVGGILSGRGAVQKAVTMLAAGATVTAGVSLAATPAKAPVRGAVAISSTANAGGARGSGAATINFNLSLKGEGVSKTDADTVANSVIERVAEALEALGFEVGLSAGGES